MAMEAQAIVVGSNGSLTARMFIRLVYTNFSRSLYDITSFRLALISTFKIASTQEYDAGWVR